jgi:putative tryptophan/tyrosine transport system substrate-binding protein
MMNRRTFLCGITLGTFSTPLAGEAQQVGKLYRIGLLFATTDNNYLQTILQGLKELGYVEGRNLAVESRSAEGRIDGLPGLAAELVRLNVEVIMAAGTAATRAAKTATATIPIVMVGAGDPVVAGFVMSLARPGGNITGTTVVPTLDLWAKELQLLTEVAPGASRIALLWNPRGLPEATATSNLKTMNDAAGKLRVTLRPVELRASDAFATTFAGMTGDRIGGIFFVPTADLFGHLPQIAELAIKHRIPLLSFYRDVAVAGALMSYGPSLSDSFRRAIDYVDKILKGAKPADLPVQQPTEFELVINLKTAKALGLTIPQSLLQRADQVIQ